MSAAAIDPVAGAIEPATMPPFDALPVPAAPSEFRHWRIDRDPDGLAWLWFDKAGESTNTFSSDAMEELRSIVERFASAATARPRALVILSAKKSGFVGRFTDRLNFSGVGRLKVDREFPGLGNFIDELRIVFRQAEHCDQLTRRLSFV